MADGTRPVVAAEELDFDLEALREKYRIERDRRLRGDGSAQYVETKGRFAHYLDDPYADPTFAREPIAVGDRGRHSRWRLRWPSRRGAPDGGRRP